MSNLFRLDGKTAIVTGGGSGIGFAIASLFAKQGAHVEILELTQETADLAIAKIESTKGSGCARQCDVSNQAVVEETISKIHAECGRIDILVNNAGIAQLGNVLDTSESDLDRVFQVNIKGVYNCMRAVVARMSNDGGGVVLNMASTLSMTAIEDRFAYGMSKGAVLTMTYSVAKDFLDQNIRCNCICPARIHTKFVDDFVAQNYPGQEDEVMERLSKAQPIGRMGRPEEVASLALYLCSDEASFSTGCAYPVDGGFLNIR